jgi:hypothetical protein
MSVKPSLPEIKTGQERPVSGPSRRYFSSSFTIWLALEKSIWPL